MPDPAPKKRRNGRSVKAKGDGYERAIATYLRDTLGIDAHRAPLSGGGFILSSGGADLIGTPGLFVEAKRTQRANLYEALAQAERNAHQTRSPECPIVVHRKDNQPLAKSGVLLRLEDFILFYRAWLEQEGYIKTYRDPDAG